MKSDAWEDFGYAVRQARLDRGWSLEELAAQALGNGARKGYVSQVEKGRRNLSPETIGKFDQALDLPTDIVKAVHLAPPPGTDQAEAEAKDFEAERMLARAARDDKTPQMAETLMIALAYEFAGGNFRDWETAYTGLRRALEAAKRLRNEGRLGGGNADNQMAQVMAEVAYLNDAGDFDAANNLLEQEEKRLKADQERLDEALRQMLDRRLAQDRLRNDPAAAADRLIADLRRQARPKGLFWATDSVIDEWSVRGRSQGDPYDLRVALALANRNAKRAKSEQVAWALMQLSFSRLYIGGRQPDTAQLIKAEQAAEAGLKRCKRARNPAMWGNLQRAYGSALRELGERAQSTALLQQAVAAHREDLATCDLAADRSNWAAAQGNLGIALQKLGEVQRQAEPLAEAVAAHKFALDATDEAADPQAWALHQNNLGHARRWLGQIASDAAQLDAAKKAYDAALKHRTRDAVPFLWATTQWNLADLALARHGFDPDTALLDTARQHVFAARGVFAEGSDYQTARCDDLLAQIDAAE